MKVFAILTALSTIVQGELAFVYELVRHGARAPLSKSPELGLFKVAVGMLTASGMRHRALLGRFNRERYVEYYKLLDETYNPSQIYVQSTPFPRTLQSGYAELMGLYPQVDTTSTAHTHFLSPKQHPPLKVHKHLLKQVNPDL